MKSIPELDAHIAKHIQGGFGPADMAVMKEECEKLKPGDVYVEIGVDEGRSARVAHEYCSEGVYKIFIDIHDPTHTPNLNRAEFMEQEGMVGLGKKGFYVHGDADEFRDCIDIMQEDYEKKPFIKLLFIDGHHDYDSIKKNTLQWEALVDGIILFHDYDHPDTKRWLNEHYRDNKEVLHNKIVRVRK